MLALCVVCGLPRGTYLPQGEYTQPDQGALSIESAGVHAEQGQSYASMAITAPDDLDPDAKLLFEQDQARRLLRSVNRLLRWHRAVTQSATVHEMTLAQASPFVILHAGGENIWGGYSASPVAVSSFSTDSKRDMAKRVRDGFAGGKEPPVEELLLLDARQALLEGRFREAVLFSWGTIDATFNIFFGQMAEERLAGDWSDGVAFIKGIDFGLRQKMSVGMRLLTGKSLFSEPDQFWERLSSSYSKRNKIIHEGQAAGEEDARMSISVADQLVVTIHNLARQHNIAMAS